MEITAGRGGKARLPIRILFRERHIHLRRALQSRCSCPSLRSALVQLCRSVRSALLLALIFGALALYNVVIASGRASEPDRRNSSRGALAFVGEKNARYVLLVD